MNRRSSSCRRKCNRELAACPQVVQFFAAEAEVCEELENITDPGCNDIIPILRHLANGQLEHRDLIHVLGGIRLSHGEFVEIGEER